MTNLPAVQEKKIGFVAKVAAVTGMVLAAGASHAAPLAIDVADVAASLTGLIVPVGVVGAAYLGVRVAIRGWKVIRGVV